MHNNKNNNNTKYHNSKHVNNVSNFTLTQVRLGSFLVLISNLFSIFIFKLSMNTKL